MMGFLFFLKLKIDSIRLNGIPPMDIFSKSSLNLHALFQVLTLNTNDLYFRFDRKPDWPIIFKYKFIYFSANGAYHCKCQIVTIHYDNRVESILPTYSKFTA